MTSGWHSPSQLTALITLDFCLSSWAWRYILNEHRIYCNKSCKLHVIYASLCHDLSSCGNWSGEVDMVRGKKREWVLVWDLFIYLFNVRKFHKEEYPDCNNTMKCTSYKINREKFNLCCTMISTFTSKIELFMTYIIHLVTYTLSFLNNWSFNIWYWS